MSFLTHFIVSARCRSFRRVLSIKAADCKSRQLTFAPPLVGVLQFFMYCPHSNASCDNFTQSLSECEITVRRFLG